LTPATGESNERVLDRATVARHTTPVAGRGLGRIPSPFVSPASVSSLIDVSENRLEASAVQGASGK